MKAVPIPGEILRTDVFMGLTFDELVILGAVPLVMVFPSLFIDQIPLVATLALIGVSLLGVIAVVIRTPEGQQPLEWAPAAVKRRLTPNEYYLKPRTRERDSVSIENRVHTASRIQSETCEEDFEWDTSVSDGTPIPYQDATGAFANEESSDRAQQIGTISGDKTQ
ncbi:PrgI family protein [Haloarcula sp. H-GB4]|uniref:PrgI family protein n=1 Tax=Haloarcula sp. H-GB4 TaxID=3069755 RepID=UPI0027B4CCAD|nr:PrgI family protein [Haloarcula sp. H-GB4]MDQ2074696.1 PrgI family protein [Haloarcula sp. H-GB4]